MKKLYILSLLVFVSFSMQAITYTSTQNGNWTTPTTWSPMGVPIPGDIVIINNDVILNTDFAYTVGSITVNASGSLIQDATNRSVWVNGINASLTNNGTTTINTLLLSDGSYANTGTFTVKVFANFITANNSGTGTIQGVDSLYNNGTINNNGQINVMAFFNDNIWNNYGNVFGLVTVVDSMVNAGTMLNDVNSILRADSCTNTGTFTNNGIINFDQYTNTGTFTNTNYLSFVDITNTGTFTNQDSLIGTESMWNTGNFDNQVGAVLNLGESLLNADFINTNAVFNNDGDFNIADSYYNYDAVTGGATGSVTVQDTSYNHTTGTMTGSFDFCDLTPPVTPIKVDFNLGTVAPTITFCLGVGITTNEITNKTSIYPNPTNGFINIALDKNFIAHIYNVIGEKIMTTSNPKIDLSIYQSGIYFIELRDESGNLIKKEKVVKY